ncbi:ubiquitin carboxyl-terminal hydrolase 2-like isoform X2 [Homalodisca vitripennis]|uniref:ubiquitin carboxyl-terminal hydrolase 2-like isoform X2 n=1 Tax=Homalodisca vitripennis TaxID=197043 RepID=UPI001EEB8A6E|nr:ubiquitin carboxyl-terminal hydrolase 2-like isoform X2 [Homalodisca vitripennis]
MLNYGVLEWTVSLCWVILLFGVLCSFGLGVFDSMDEKMNTVLFSYEARGSVYQKTLLISRKVNTKETERESITQSKTKTSQDQGGLTGLSNIGNTCFLNAIVQCLSNTKVLLEYITNKDYINEIRSSAKASLMKRFADLIKGLWQGGISSITILSFKKEVDVYAPRFLGYAQQDAQEFLRYLLEGLHDELNRVTSQSRNLTEEIDDDLSDSLKAVETWKRYLKFDNSKIVDTFGGLLKSTLECTHCGHCSTTFEPFWDLSLPIPHTLRTGKLMLSQCFDLFTKEEVLDGDEMPTCSKCNTRRKCKKRILIQKFPEVLVIHLKRFSLGGRSCKVESTIDFPVSNLDVAAYSADSQVKNLGYDLYAVVNHNGTCYTGHYTAYCKHPYSGEWHSFNDLSVRPISPETHNKRDAYVLFYEQNQSTNL